VSEVSFSRVARVSVIVIMRRMYCTEDVCNSCINMSILQFQAKRSDLSDLHF
jgi:hypothetical protein